MLAAAAAVAALAGCQSMTGSTDAPAASGDTWAQQDNFTDPNGGYTFQSETAAFGDPALLQMEITERSDFAAPDSIPSDSTETAFFVRLTWGQLEGNPASTTPLDWSGSIGVDAGGFAVVRTIGFEILQGDHLLPRTNRQSLEFVSHTTTRFDGVLLLVHPEATFGGTAAAGSLTFSTGPLTQSWTFDALRTAHLVIPVGDAGNAVAVTGLPLRPRPANCGQGFVRGAWAHRETGENEPVRGFFRGLWVLDDGRAVGHIHGHFGTNAAGEHVWFGKIIGRDGRVIGLASGTYTPNADPATAGGTFAGDIVTQEGGPVAGHTEGRYLPGRPDQDPAQPDPRGGDSRFGLPGAAGFLEGTWSIQCP
jgi:hypothetical protein